MLNWVQNTIGSWLGGITAAVRSFVQTLISGLAAVLDTVFGDVTAAWNALAQVTEIYAGAAARALAADYNALRQVIGYDIPHYAQAAWWWVNHPAALADLLFWHLIALLERRAWDVAKRLGAFTLSLIWHNAADVAAVLEDIITAVL